MDSVTIRITKSLAGQTIKAYLKSMHVGRGKIEEIRVKKTACIQGIPVPLETILKENDTLSFLFSEKIDCLPSDAFPLEVLYEDDAICIVNKPARLLVHDDGETASPTLCNLVAHVYYQKKIYRPIRFIHRLDQDTTGIVLFAKDFLSEAKLHADMEAHRIEREYLGIVTNRFKEKAGTIQKPIGRDRHHAKKRRISSQGQMAITHYQVEKEIARDLSLVRFRLETGRTHQIRVHMSAMHHPLLGDALYGENSGRFSRVALHSASIRLFHPLTNAYLKIDCPLPKDMVDLIEKGERHEEN